jgi:hypothetical protein
VAAALVVALAPVIAVLVTRVGRSYLPVQDPAGIDLMVRDVFTSHPPLVGAYSRGFNHPGPWLFWVLAPLSAITGGAPWATLVGAALLQGVGIAGTAWIAFRRGATGLMLLMLAALGFAYTGLGTVGQFTWAWNPFVAFPIFVMFLLSVWAWATGDRWQLLVGVVAGSFVVQAHLGYAPLVGAALLWGALVVLSERAAAPHGPRWSIVLAWTAGASVVLWTPPLVQQLTGASGNLGAMWRFFTAGGSVVGLRDGAGILAAEFAPVPPWLGGHETLVLFRGTVEPASPAWLLVPALLLTVGFVAARRSGRRADRRLVELAAVIAVVSVLALSRISVEAEPYLFYWRISVAAFVVAASVWALGNSLGVAARPTARRVGAGALMVAILLGFGSQAIDVVNRSDRVAGIEGAAEHIMRQVRDAGYPDRPVLVRALGSTDGGLDQGVIDALDRAGAPVRVDPRYGYHFGEQRVATRGGVAEIWYVAEEGRYRSLLSEMPGARVIGSSSPLRPADERELRRLQRAAARTLTDSGHADLVDDLDNPFFGLLVERARVPGLSRQTVARIVQLNAKVERSHSCRCSITAFQAATAPTFPYTLG